MRQALNIRVPLGDRTGVDVTGHNLNLVHPPPPSTPPRAPSNLPSPSQPPSHYRVASERQALAWLPVAVGYRRAERDRHNLDSPDAASWAACHRAAARHTTNFRIAKCAATDSVTYNKGTAH